MKYRIKDWHRFQHFKDRRPPWIKLYRDILDDPDWHSLDGESAKILTMLWLIASEDENKEGNLPEVRKIAFRFRIDEKTLKQHIIKLSHWVEQVDINVISECYQVDAPETETETETEKKKTAKRELIFPEIEDRQLVDDWLAIRKLKKLPVTKNAVDGFLREVSKSGWTLTDVLKKCCEKGWGGFEAKWIKDEIKESVKLSYPGNGLPFSAWNSASDEEKARMVEKYGK